MTVDDWDASPSVAAARSMGHDCCFAEDSNGQSVEAFEGGETETVVTESGQDLK